MFSSLLENLSYHYDVLKAKPMPIAWLLSGIMIAISIYIKANDRLSDLIYNETGIEQNIAIIISDYILPFIIALILIIACSYSFYLHRKNCERYSMW